MEGVITSIPTCKVARLTKLLETWRLRPEGRVVLLAERNFSPKFPPEPPFQVLVVADEASRDDAVCSSALLKFRVLFLIESLVNPYRIRSLSENCSKSRNVIRVHKSAQAETKKLVTEQSEDSG